MELLNTATRISFSHCTITDNGHIFGYAHDIQSAAPTNRYRACAPNAVGHHLVRWFRPSVYLISTQNMCWLRWRNTANGHASRWRRSCSIGASIIVQVQYQTPTVIPIVKYVYQDFSVKVGFREYPDSVLRRPEFVQQDIYVCIHRM